ncbi:hypothetical protein KR009_007920 [Drosophila setifemur]|nr:hypothetical protein KR009_007920 [Drosophila setifemur]
MSREIVATPDPEKTYLITYEMGVPEDTVEGLLPIVALKAEQLKVRGYITHTHGGRKVGGELEGREEGLKLMVEWLKEKSQQKDGPDEKRGQMAEPRFSKWKLQSGAKYDDFFYC